MNRDTTWQRVSKMHPCPICERLDWYLLTSIEGNPTAVICAHVESKKRCGDAGWLHRLRDDESWQRTHRRTVGVPTPHQTSLPDIVGLAKRYAAGILSEAVNRLADDLGLSAKSLRRLCMGSSAEHRAYTFPMADGAGNVLGIRLRLHCGRKLSVRDGKEGLFIPGDLPDAGPLLICEGPTDAAAMLDLGFATVGRPSCSGGMRFLVDLAQRRRAAELVIVGDNDESDAGQRRAENLASVLVAFSASVRVIAPPTNSKDAREWKLRGATHADVKVVIDAAPVRHLTIRSRKVGHHGKA